MGRQRRPPYLGAALLLPAPPRSWKGGVLLWQLQLNLFVLPPATHLREKENETLWAVGCVRSGCRLSSDPSVESRGRPKDDLRR